MTQSSEEAGKSAKAPVHREATNQSRGQQPDWATGLRRLYDSVVEEPLPDTLKDLLAKLDDN